VTLPTLVLLLFTIIAGSASLWTEEDCLVSH